MNWMLASAMTVYQGHMHKDGQIAKEYEQVTDGLWYSTQ